SRATPSAIRSSNQESKITNPKCCMELWLYDNSTKTRQTLNIEADPILIGRDAECDVVLRSPFVARRHARIARKGIQFFVENLGKSGTRVANREVLAGQPHRVDFGDEVQIAQFSLAMIRPEGRGGAISGDRHELQRRLMTFEQSIHAELLDRMNLRVTGHLN